MMRRIVAGVAIALGVAVILIPIVLSLFSETLAAQRMADTIQPVMNRPALVAKDNAVKLAAAGVAELESTVLPAWRRALHLSPGAFDARYPDVLAGLRIAPQYEHDASQLDPVLIASPSKFASADSIPFGGISLSTTPWYFIAFGVALILAGIGVLLTRSLAALGVLLVLGVAAIVAPFAISLPQKAGDAQDLVNAMRPFMTTQVSNRYIHQSVVFGKMIGQLRNQVIRAYASGINQSPAQVNASIARNTPHVAALLTQGGHIAGAMFATDLEHRAQVARFDQTKKIPFRALAWMSVVPGLIAALAAFVALAYRPSRQPRTTAAEQLATV